MIRPGRDVRRAFRHLICIFHHTGRLNAAYDAMRAQDWQGAERDIEACFKAFELQIPSRDAIPLMNISAAVIYYRNHKAEPALKALEATIDQLRAGRIGSLPDASYLARYCFELAEFCAGRFPDHEPAFLAEASRAQEQTLPFSLLKVRRDFRSLFPLSPRAESNSG